jgi:hypothetical protein
MGNLAQNTYATMHRCDETFGDPRRLGLHKVNGCPTNREEPPLSPQNSNLARSGLSGQRP